jgi:hypothetical protein
MTTEKKCANLNLCRREEIQGHKAGVRITKWQCSVYYEFEGR